MKSLFILALASTTIAVEPVSIKANWAWIHSASANYLQLEAYDLPGGIEPLIDSVRVEATGGKSARANVRVFWKTGAIPAIDPGADVRRAQILRRVDDGVLTLDSVFSCPSGVCEPVGALPRVENVPPQNLICTTLPCSAMDSATALANLESAIEHAGWAGILDPGMISTLVKPEWWARTDGTENLVEVVAPLRSNANNWIDLDRVQMGLARSIKTKVVETGTYEVFTGKVDYVYNRLSIPTGNSLIPVASRLFIGDLLKSGPELHLSGSTQRVCERLAFDSLMGKNAWLVAAAGSSRPEIGAAMAYNTACFRRVSAWKVVADTVWLTDKVKVQLSEVMKTVSVTVAPARGSGAQLLQGPGRVMLDLPQESDLSLTTMDGRLVSKVRLGSGIHPLGLESERGLLLLRVKAVRTGELSVVRVFRP